jgi:hypothetical protein
MFNPNKINDTKATNYGSIEVPGASHPIVQFGSGGARMINFNLWVDGDRGRFGRKQARNNSSLSISDELAWYRSLEYPVSYNMAVSDVFPYLVLFSFGELYQNVQCVVRKADWDVNFWTPELQPVRATIPIQLEEVVTQSVTQDQFAGLIAGFGTSVEFG